MDSEIEKLAFGTSKEGGEEDAVAVAATDIEAAVEPSVISVLVEERLFHPGMYLVLQYRRVAVVIRFVLSLSYRFGIFFLAIGLVEHVTLDISQSGGSRLYFFGTKYIYGNGLKHVVAAC